MSEDALVMREDRGNITVLTMVYRPYNLLGPKLINAIVEQVEAAEKAGSRAIVIRSGLRREFLRREGVGRMQGRRRGSDRSLRRG